MNRRDTRRMPTPMNAKARWSQMDIAVGVRHWVTPRSLAMWQEKLDAISPPKAKIRRPIPSPSVAQRSAPSRGTRASRATWSGSAVHHGSNRLIRLRELTEIILTPHRISAPLSLPGHRTFPTPEGRTLPHASVITPDRLRAGNRSVGAGLPVGGAFGELGAVEEVAVGAVGLHDPEVGEEVAAAVGAEDDALAGGGERRAGVEVGAGGEALQAGAVGVHHEDPPGVVEVSFEDELRAVRRPCHLAVVVLGVGDLRDLVGVEVEDVDVADVALRESPRERDLAARRSRRPKCERRPGSLSLLLGLASA